jgi:Mrp family chromosome partitioning ATPase/capsular polysaccharide biosynthesis protein
LRDDRPSSVRFYLAVARRRWPVILVLFVIPIAVAVVLTAGATKKYKGTALVVINRQSLSDEVTGTANPAASSSDFLNVVTTYAAAAHSIEVATAAAAAVPRAHLTGRQLLKDATVTARSNADIVEVSVINADPALALQLSRTYANTFVAYQKRLDIVAINRALAQVDANLTAAQVSGDKALVDNFRSRDSQLRALRTLQTDNEYVVDPTTSASQTSPRKSLDIGLGVLAGIVLALLAAATLETLDTRVTDAEEIAEIIGAPSLGRLSSSRGDGSSTVMSLSDPSNHGTEDYRILRTNLQLQTLHGDSHVFLVTAAAEPTRTAQVVANLGALAARAGQRAIVVDLNLRTPSLGAMLAGEPTGGGITDVLLGNSEIGDALLEIPIPGHGETGTGVAGSLRLLASGSLPPDPGDLIASDRMRAVLASIRGQSDVVYIDTSSASADGDALALSALCDAVLLVLPSDRASRRSLSEISRSLRRSPARLAGFVVYRVARGA